MKKAGNMARLNNRQSPALESHWKTLYIPPCEHYVVVISDLLPVGELAMGFVAAGHKGPIDIVETPISIILK